MDAVGDSMHSYDENREKMGNRLVYQIIKRVFDIVASLIGIIILSPLFLITAIVILVEDGRPFIYKQIRVGQDKRDFEIYKFRSMRKDAEEIHERMKAEYGSDEVSFKLKDDEDPRLLKCGHTIRRFNIDELPQLINILKGDMSLVGPRPLPKYEAVETDERYGNLYDERYKVPQGLTCYWQMANRADCSYEHRMELDCKYAEDSNLLIDLILVLKTARFSMTGRAEY